MQLVEEARLYHLLPDRRSEFGTTKRCKPRKNAGTTQVIAKNTFVYLEIFALACDEPIILSQLSIYHLIGNCFGWRRGR